MVSVGGRPDVSLGDLDTVGGGGIPLEQAVSRGLDALVAAPAEHLKIIVTP